MESLLSDLTSPEIHNSTQPDFVHYSWVCYSEGSLYVYHLIISVQSPLAMASDTPTTCTPLHHALKKDHVGYYVTEINVIQNTRVFTFYLWVMIYCSLAGK
jgi:hypothetical protein